MKLKIINGNPWGKNLPDCTLRALCLGLNYSYVEMCKIFNAPCKIGKGLAKQDGLATVDEVIEVCTKHNFINTSDVDHIMDDVFTKDNILKDLDGDYYDEDDYMIDVEMGDSIFEWAEMYPPGRYILFVRPTAKNRKIGDLDWHSTLLNNTNKVLFDTFDPTKGTYVFGYMQINPSAILPVDHPKSRTVELEAIRNGTLRSRSTATPTVKKRTTSRKAR